MPSRAARLIAASLVATLAFWAYTQTLLPGVDAGDTGGFQAAVLWPEISARQAYPLYYDLAYPFVRTASANNPARGLNLFSAIWGAVAVGLLTLFTATIASSIGAGVVAGVLLAFSYTFWTQAIIAEVYTLHLALILLCLVALYVYARRPDLPRLAIVFAVYAVAFGNHLSMILLLIPFAAFIVIQTPRRSELLRPRVVILAVGIAMLAALQYLPNLLAVGWSPDAPASTVDRLAAFWFDTTKADWRESMVLGVRSAQIANRFGMWWFDLRQQFGIVGVVLAIAGVPVLLRKTPAWAAMLLATFAICTTFALTYNVGDAHVFFLPSHLITAMFAGAAVSWPAAFRPAQPLSASARSRLTIQAASVIVALALAYGGWRGWDTWPVVDRHDDHRAEALVRRLTFGLNSRSAILVTQLDWQIENVLLYYGRYVDTAIAWVRLADVMGSLPFLVDDTHAAARDVVLTTDAARDVVGAYAQAFAIVEDPALPTVSLATVVARMPRGAPYVLCVLTPPRDQPLDADAFARSLQDLTGGHPPWLDGLAYQVVAGLAGEAPSYVRSSAGPFRETFALQDEPFTVRMEAWLGTDTFRRAGFGHVLRGRDHVLTIERGVSLVSLTASGEAAPPTYAAGLYAARPRYRIPAGAPVLASLVAARP